MSTGASDATGTERERNMEEQTLTPGPRQTVDRAKHPTLGEGIAVHEHGPAFFQPDGGEPVAMRSIRFGGVGEGGSYLLARTEDEQEIRLDTTKRERGEQHKRAWTALLGPGWLVTEGADPDRLMRERFEPDSGGAPLRLRVAVIEVGRPGALTRWTKRRKQGSKEGLPEEERGWFTLTLADGATICFFDGDTPPGDASAATPEQTPAKKSGTKRNAPRVAACVEGVATPRPTPPRSPAPPGEARCRHGERCDFDRINDPARVDLSAVKLCGTHAAAVRTTQDAAHKEAAMRRSNGARV